MEPFVKLTGLVAPVDRVNVDTDAIIPKQFLKRIEKSGFGQFLFFEFRYDKDGNTIESFSLNQKRYEGASVLLSRSNFGCGSSREHAPWAILDYGFRAVIASSFADIFYSNCLNNGILPIKLTEEEVDYLFNETNAKEGYALTIDLESQTVATDKGDIFSFPIGDFHRYKLLNGLDEIGLTLLHEDKITAYEKAHA